MRKTFGFLVFVAAACGVFIFLFSSMDEQIQRLKFALARQELKQAFALKVPQLAAADEEHAVFDLTQAVRNYAKELEEIYRKYPQFKDPDSVLKRYEKEIAEGRKDEIKMAQARERVELVRAVWEALRADKYQPVAVARDKSLRVDIQAIDRKKLDGQDKLHVHALFVGAPPDKSMSYGAIEIKMALADDPETAKKRAAGQLKDNKKPLEAQVTGSSEPHLMVLEPDRFYEDFPPGIAIGYYEFPLFPHESQEMAMLMTFDTKNPGGGHVNNELKFKPLTLRDDWKLPPGTAYAADEQQVDE